MESEQVLLDLRSKPSPERGYLRRVFFTLAICLLIIFTLVRGWSFDKKEGAFFFALALAAFITIRGELQHKFQLRLIQIQNDTATIEYYLRDEPNTLQVPVTDLSAKVKEEWGKQVHWYLRIYVKGKKLGDQFETVDIPPDLIWSLQDALNTRSGARGSQRFYWRDLFKRIRF